LSAAQSSILNALLGNQGYGKMDRMAEYESMAKPGTAYSVTEFLGDVRSGVFSELPKGEKVDVYRRALQRAYVEALNNKLNPPTAAPAAAGGRGGGGARGGARGLNPKLSDVPAVVRNELKELDREIQDAASKTQDKMTKAHLDDLRKRIADALKGKSGVEDTTNDLPGLVGIKK
jgi:hypothetical protein